MSIKCTGWFPPVTSFSVFDKTNLSVSIDTFHSSNVNLNLSWVNWKKRIRNFKDMYNDILPKHMAVSSLKNSLLSESKSFSGNLLFKCFKKLINVTFSLYALKTLSRKVTNFQRVYFCNYRSLALVPLHTHKKPFHNLRSNLLYINFNSVLPATSASLRFF